MKPARKTEERACIFYYIKERGCVHFWFSLSETLDPQLRLSMNHEYNSRTTISTEQRIRENICTLVVTSEAGQAMMVERTEWVLDASVIHPSIQSVILVEALLWAEHWFRGRGWIEQCPWPGSHHLEKWTERRTNSSKSEYIPIWEPIEGSSEF